MIVAFLSDIHGNLPALQRALADAIAYGATRIICLGDVGGSDCLDALAQARAECVFGNWEVSRWTRVAQRHWQWIRHWPPAIEGTRFIAVHAAPFWPDGLESLDDFSTYQRQHRVSWLTLFPRLSQDEEARWQALAGLEERNKRICFYGHTHIQDVWHFAVSGHLRQAKGTNLPLTNDGSRYLIGVGSVGQPVDGPGICYALYDEKSHHVWLRRLIE